MPLAEGADDALAAGPGAEADRARRDDLHPERDFEGRDRARGENDVLRGETRNRAVTRRELHLTIGEQSPGPGQRGHAVALKELRDSACQSLNHRVLARHHGGHIDFHRARANTQLGKPGARDRKSTRLNSSHRL